MSKYIHLFRTDNEFKGGYIGENYNEPWLSRTLESDKVKYNKTEYEKLLETPLTFDITSDGIINWGAANSSFTSTLEYSKDNGKTWTSITSSTAGTKVNVATGDKVIFRGDNDAYAKASGTQWNNFSGTTAGFKLSGNIMSLLTSTDFIYLSTFKSGYTFYSLFNNCTGLTDASKLLLPAMSLTGSCYCGMFSGCTSLITSPNLPATTLADHCYQSMFHNCVSLTRVPELQATELAPFCYQSMFRGCSSLVEPPELHALVLRSYCYNEMFMDCTSLTKTPELPATEIAGYCYQSMFQGCRSLLNAPDLPAMTLYWYCYCCMFQGCTSLTTAPELPAPAVTGLCYFGMFSGCTNLNYVKCLATVGITTETFPMDNMLANVSRTGTYVKPASAPEGSHIPGTWTIVNI